MPAIRTIGIVIMAALTASIGVVGYLSFQQISANREAREALQAVGGACEEVIASGSPRVVGITIPQGYSMRFVDNQIFIDGQRYSATGLAARFSENFILGTGSHTLSIGISQQGLVVLRM